MTSKKILFLAILSLCFLSSCRECGNGTCIKGEDFLSCSQDCPSCDDTKTYTKDTFNYDTQLCENEVLQNSCGNSKCDSNEDFKLCPLDCKNCDDVDACTLDSFIYKTQSCSNFPLTPCCGNKVCEKGEVGKCSNDCKPGDVPVKSIKDILEDSLKLKTPPAKPTSTGTTSTGATSTGVTSSGTTSTGATSSGTTDKTKDALKDFFKK